MKVLIAPNYEEMSLIGANFIREEIQSKQGEKCVLGLATGNTPVGMLSVGKPVGVYENLISWNADGVISFANVVTYNLDEYLGLPPFHDQSYTYLMNHYLFDHIDIDRQNTHVPNGLASDPIKVSEQYERLIKSDGGIDLQLLGLGRDGHIGFVMPVFEDSKLSLGETRTQVFELSEVTRTDNATFFGGDMDAVPTHAISMGISSILDSRKIILLASGQKKAEAVRKMATGPVTSEVPASYLKRHPNCTIIIDLLAGAELMWELIQQGQSNRFCPAALFGVKVIEIDVEKEKLGE